MGWTIFIFAPAICFISRVPKPVKVTNAMNFDFNIRFNETAIKVAKQISMKQRYSRVIFFFLNLVFFLLENITIKTIEIS